MGFSRRMPALVAVPQVALAVLMGGCAHREPRLSTPIETPASAFESALEAVHGGAQESAHVGRFVIARAGDGSLRVTPDDAPARPPPSDENGWIATRLHHQYAADSDPKAGDVEVSADAGVVTLRGAVRSSYEASRAIRQALETPGVIAVDSALRYPAANQASISPH